ncbi:glycosyltransferase [Pleomorphovibrio marinus]|uniref:glycosyltransferase n=1 Tax=Pleomorphovibrio marinus TaxID=2164132 RepID=UPI000E0ADC97|nr:glycosyltransferase [Pleomorphovibrio marinus]
MRKKIKILLANSYSFDKINEDYINKVGPSHYLMGLVELNKFDDMEVDVLKHQKYIWLNKLGDKIKIPFLDQQIRLLFKIRKYDILYFPYPLSNTRLLMMLKQLGIIKIPIAVLVHQNFFHYFKKKSFIDKVNYNAIFNYDYFIFFSLNLLEVFKKEFKGQNIDSEGKFHYAMWGPDIEFYSNYKPSGHLVKEKQKPYAICAGTSDRDFEMLIEAFEGLDIDLRIHTKPECVSNIDNIPHNVQIITEWTPYNSLIEYYKKSEFIIIPLKKEVIPIGNTYGLTVLLDAIAIGKPVIMTHHNFVDIDIEREEFGLWVKDNSVEGWRNKLKEMIQLRERYDVMGENAKRKSKSININHFSTQVNKIFRKIKSY